MNNGEYLLTSDDFPIGKEIEKLESELNKTEEMISELNSTKSEINSNLFNLYKRFYDDCRDDD